MSEINFTILYNQTKVPKASPLLAFQRAILDLSTEIGIVKYSLTNIMAKSRAMYDSKSLTTIQEKVHELILSQIDFVDVTPLDTILNREITMIKNTVSYMKDVDYHQNISKSLTLPGVDLIECSIFKCRNQCLHIEGMLNVMSSSHTVSRDLLVIINKLADYFFFLASYYVFSIYKRPSRLRSDKLTLLQEDKLFSKMEKMDQKMDVILSKNSRRTSNSDSGSSDSGSRGKKPAVRSKSASTKIPKLKLKSLSAEDLSEDEPDYKNDTPSFMQNSDRRVIRH